MNKYWYYQPRLNRVTLFKDNFYSKRRDVCTRKFFHKYNTCLHVDRKEIVKNCYLLIDLIFLLIEVKWVEKNLV